MVSAEAVVIRKYRFILALLSAIFLFSHTGAVYGQALNRDIEELIQDIVSDVINRTVDKAEVVYRNTGIDVGQEVYTPGRRHEPLPRNASDETRRELVQLRREHDR